MIPRHILGVIVLAVAVLGTVGHVCVLPLDTHAAEADAHHHGGGFHEASCEALRTPPASDERTHAIALVTVAAVTDAIVVHDYPFAVRRTLVGRGSPPLFLLHATLLI